MSAYYNVSEREYQNVLLHEMIHYYLSYKGIRDTSPHGREFRRLMEWLNREHGWHITVSTRTKGWDVSAHNQPRLHRQRHVIMVETTDDRCFVGVVHADYVRYVDRQARQSSLVKNHYWFVSDADMFADYPQSRSLRGRRMKRQAFDQLLNQLREASL